MDDWVQINQLLYSVRSVLFFVIHLASAIVVGFKFRRSMTAAVAGVGAFLLMILTSGLYMVLPKVLGGDFHKIAGFLGFGYVLAAILLFTALLLAPTRGDDFGPGS